MSDKTYKFMCRLSNVQRFQGRAISAQYSVADHTMRVVYLAMRLADECGLDVNTEKVMKQALFHDFEESLLGDIPGPYKKYIKQEYQKAAKEAIRSEVRLPREYLHAWENCKDRLTVEGEIVEIADKLECFITCAYELEQGNNKLRDTFEQLSSYFSMKEERISRFFPYAQELIEKGRNDVRQITI